MVEKYAANGTVEQRSDSGDSVKVGGQWYGARFCKDAASKEVIKASVTGDVLGLEYEVNTKDGKTYRNVLKAVKNPAGTPAPTAPVVGGASFGYQSTPAVPKAPRVLTPADRDRIIKEVFEDIRVGLLAARDAYKSATSLEPDAKLMDFAAMMNTGMIEVFKREGRERNQSGD